MTAAQTASCTLTVAPAMVAGKSASRALSITPAMTASNSAGIAFAIAPSMAAGSTAGGTLAIAPTMSTGNTADGTLVTAPGMGTENTADSARGVAPDVAAGSTAITALTIDPVVTAKRGTLQLIDRAGFHFAGCTCCYSSITPCREIRPTFIGKLLLIGGIVLRMNLSYEEPCGISVGAGTAGSLVTHIRGIAGVGAGFGGTVVGMENVVGAGLTGIGVMIGIRRATPVIVQITRLAVRSDTSLVRSCFRGSHFRGLFIVLGINAAGGIEAGGPTIDIVNRAGAGLNPCAALQSIAGHRAFGRRNRLVIRITVLGLTSEQAGIHIAGDIIQPLGGHIAGIQFIVVTAGGTSEFVDCVFTAGGSVFNHVIVMTGGGNNLLLNFFTSGTGSGLVAIGSAGSIYGGPCTIGVTAGRSRCFSNKTAGRTGLHLYTAGSTGRSLNRGSGIGVAAGRLIHGR